MKYILLLVSVLLVPNILAAPDCKIKKPKIQSHLALKKATIKRLQERITQQGALLAFVDSDTALVGTQFPPVEAHQSTIDWARLAQSVTEPGKLINHLGN